MKITKLVKDKKNLYKVYFDIREPLCLYDDLIVQYNLLSNKEIDNKKLDEILTINEEYIAYYKALKYISIKLRSELEVKKYLHEYKEKIIVKTIKKLKNEGYLNEKKYIECFVNDQIILTNNGPLKIKSNLIKLGLPELLIDDYLGSLKEDIFVNKMKKYIQKQIGLNHKSINSLKLKLKTNLNNLGYNNYLINEAISNINIDDSESLKKDLTLLRIKLSKKYSGTKLELMLKNKLLAKGYRYDDILKEIE